ncbi:Rpn family recombination-promoting nuclease/putative transposase [Crocosphaera sp. XPORK-15E]|uniref:Rpn family recombination-promoting nuclease/putative transposase n=1 Tax=Crocosphaera sp. XPORK-15E TaxID=3110247 RepID=UPI002B1F62E6|nr:Rpn family recombination-promoting nuclease/putative transposase [Crocosphaera sp. XPORK-15E]MEA5533544.1 Rpn family recombination-promoting nuclease/putative transposase [Crocosphaera sp. XPORK-15E]
MYDNTCKFIAETFPDAIATWLLGSPIQLTQLSPTELSNEPIRADALILKQSDNLVLHAEFQTSPKDDIPFRMADYRLRVYRRFPGKKMVQVVIYLRPTDSALVYQDSFNLEETNHRFRIIRLWEQTTETFLTLPGLLPFAVLSKTDNPKQVLNQVAQIVNNISEKRTQSNLAAASGILAGLVLKQETIHQILRRDIMRESVIYQEILQEGEQRGEQRGREEAKAEIALNLLREGMTIEQIVKVTGLSLEFVQNLARDVNNN